MSNFYYSQPVYGRAYKPFSTEMVEVNSDNSKTFKFKKTVRWKKQDFAIFINEAGEEIMQSLAAIRFVRCKPGEDNYMSKLSNEQGLEIFRRSNEGESNATLAKEFGVSERYISDIKNIRARVRITLDYMNGTPKNEPAMATVAKRNKNKKLSPSLAKFIRSDKANMKMTTQQLATKYCVSDRTIQRILKNQMYK